MDQLHSDLIIKEEHNEFNSDAEEEECFYKEAFNILCGSNMELLSIKHENSCDSLVDIKNEGGECYNESILVTHINTKKDVVKKEFQNEKDEEMSEIEKNHNIIKHEIDDRLHSELMIKEEDELGSSDGIISTTSKDKNDLESDSACSSLENETKDYLAGKESELCSSFARTTNTRKLSTIVISSSNESDLNESLINLKVENKPMNKKVKKKIRNISKNSSQIHSISPTIRERSFKCETCEKTFSSKKYLRVHSFTHTEDSPFKCEICEKTFSSRYYFKIHTFTHTGQSPFKCDKCEKTFSIQQSLIRHTFTHTGENPFKCDKCKKTFSQKHSLRVHYFTHTGDKPFKCEKCDKTFSRKQHFISHTLTHTAENPFKCDKCGKVFSQKHNLRVHNFTHTGEKPFKCEKCKKTFTTKQALIKHTLTHSEERTFKCDTCEKSFSTKDGLKYHSFIHTGERPFKCDKCKCKKIFCYKQGLKKHICVKKA